MSDNEYFGNFSEENASRSDSQDGEEISFLAKDSNQQKVSYFLIKQLPSMAEE